MQEEEEKGQVQQKEDWEEVQTDMREVLYGQLDGGRRTHSRAAAPPLGGSMSAALEGQAGGGGLGFVDRGRGTLAHRRLRAVT